MSCSSGPNLVTNGLILELDAANSKSYSGTGNTWIDLSGNGNNGTLTNGPTYSTSNNGSIVLDGVNDFISLPYTSLINSATTFTIDVWFKSNTISNEQVLFSTSSSTGPTGWHVEIYQSKIIMQVYPGGSYTFSTQTLNSSTIYNVSVTYNSGNINYYINGTPAGTASYTFTPSNVNPAIGTFTYSNNYYFGGNIYNTKFYNIALTSEQVLQNFNALRSRFGV